MMDPLKVDPTRTLTLRAQFMADMKRRFRALLKAIDDLVVGEGAFTVPSTHVTFNKEAGRWAFQTDDQKVDSFQQWFQGEVDKGILEVSGTGKPWTNTYVESAYKKGVLRAYMDSHKEDTDKPAGFMEGTREQFLQQAFGAPEAVSKIKLLGTRTFEQLKGFSAQMATDTRRVLMDGISRGANPRQIATQLKKQVAGMGNKRAATIARTEIIHAHAEGQLDSFDRLGAEELAIMAEWSTAGDDRVCPQCAPLEGTVFTVKEARGLIPRHPNCRCAWVPANVGEKETGQKWSIGAKEQAVAESVRAETGERDTASAKAGSAWLGADKRITRAGAGFPEQIGPQRGPETPQEPTPAPKAGDSTPPAPRPVPTPKPEPKKVTEPVPEPKKPVKKKTKVIKPKETGDEKTARLRKELEAQKAATEAKRLELEAALAKKAAADKEAARQKAIEAEKIKKEQEAKAAADAKLGLPMAEKRKLAAEVKTGAEAEVFLKDHFGAPFKFNDTGAMKLDYNEKASVQAILNGYMDVVGRKGIQENGMALKQVTVTQGSEIADKKVSRRAGGFYRPRLQDITVGDIQNGYSWDKPKIGKDFANVDYSVSGVLRHELGHSFHTGLESKPDVIEAWEGTMKSVGRKKNAPSSYGSSNPKEFFAESFCAYTHPNYEKGTLPKPIEDFFDTHVGGLE